VAGFGLGWARPCFHSGRAGVFQTMHISSSNRNLAALLHVGMDIGQLPNMVSIRTAHEVISDMAKLHTAASY